VTRSKVVPLSVFDDLPSSWTSTAVVEWLATGLLVTVALALVVRTVRRSRRLNASTHRPNAPAAGLDAATTGRRWLIGLAVAAAIGVAAVGGVRSFEAVSITFGSPLVPLTADGMIIACTALRLAALTRGWRLPGSVATTYGFIAGTVWLNVAAGHGWTDAVAHALAPVSYAVLVEMLAHLLRLHLRLAQPTRPRVTALTLFTSPIVTTRVWLHMARTGEADPLAARALVQQVIRMSSRLAAICPSRLGLGRLPFGRARASRVAALQTIRDGLLSAADLASLLPADTTTQLTPGALLALVDRAALQCTAPASAVRTDQRTAHRTADADGAPPQDRTSAPELHRITGRALTPTVESGASGPGRDSRTDDELVAALHDHATTHNDGRPLSQREVMRVLGVGTPKAKRLASRAGWIAPTTAATDEAAAARQPPAQVPGQLALVEPHAVSAGEDSQVPTRSSR
jgi:Protein of unknown function (DUF2637)